ncbi:MAG: universal stress protein [Gammaproteobacteria bacterium]|jgi:universal stress protein E|nr:universal stress protein [Gammaproteobacteria bacterium]MDP6732433.1 universal stress protein [Gammaproteobacteria bacterium]
MDKIESILVVVDPTVDRDFSIDKAKQIAKVTGSRVRFFINNPNTLSDHSYIYEGIDGNFFETQRRLYEEHYHKLLENLVEEFSAENIEASTAFTEQHHLAESIIAQADEYKPDLILKSTHHHSLIERSLITNTDWRLIRKCLTPLLLVKPVLWSDDGSVVTAVDPLHSKAAQNKLDHVLLAGTQFVARIFKFKPCVFHSYYPFVSTMFPMGGESKEHLDRIRQHHAEQLNELIEGYDFADDGIELSEGDLVPELTLYLQSVQANILVIGALSRNVIERAIIGNTAEKILEDCPCDVLVLKS